MLLSLPPSSRFANHISTHATAPSSQAAAVGNMVQAKKPSVFGVAVPSFIAKTFGVRYEGHKVSDIDNDRMETMMLELEEECYLGKDGDLEECADFDP